MSNPFCPICNLRLSGALSYCSIRHRDRAKYLRRRARDRGFLSPKPESAPAPFWPDPLDLGTLSMFCDTLEPNGEIWFEKAEAFAAWQAPDGFIWEILSDGKGRLKKTL